ncbi:Mor transcription activator family protein [Variovorax gossypii]
MTDPVESTAAVRRHELLADVAEATARELHEKHGVDLDTAADVGNALADFLSDRWKGQNIYMVSDREFKLSKRDQEIYERMRRGNANELAAEMGISYVRVHQIYKRVLLEARRRVQPDLFNGGDAGSAPDEGEASMPAQGG